LLLIASGGIGSIDDLKKLEETGIDATVVGMALYTGKINIVEWK